MSLLRLNGCKVCSLEVDQQLARPFDLPGADGRPTVALLIAKILVSVPEVPKKEFTVPLI